MLLPIWLIALRDPADAYILLSRGTRPHGARFRRRGNPRRADGYALLSSGRPADLPQLTDEQLDQLRSRAADAGRFFIARVRAVEARHDELLRAAGADLSRLGAVTLRTTAGDIHSRVIRFRNDAVVLETVYPGGWSQSRSTGSMVAVACAHALANAVAQIGQAAEPLGQ